MDHSKFSNLVKSGNKDEYVNNNIKNHIVNKFNFKVEEAEGLSDDRRGGKNSILSVSLPHQNEMNNRELINKSKEKIKSNNSDIQKLNLIDNGRVSNTIIILKSDYGYEIIAKNIS